MVNRFSLKARRASSLRAHKNLSSVDVLALRGGLDKRDLKCLAAAGALAELAGHRRQAYWAVAGIEPATPLTHAPAEEMQPQLLAPTEGQDPAADYASLGTLGRHPLALLRPHLQRQRLVSAAQLRNLPHGQSPAPPAW